MNTIEMPENLGMSDRILVMREGRLVAEFSPRRPPRDIGWRDGRPREHGKERQLATGRCRMASIRKR